VAIRPHCAAVAEARLITTYGKIAGTHFVQVRNGRIRIRQPADIADRRTDVLTGRVGELLQRPLRAIVVNSLIMTLVEVSIWSQGPIAAISAIALLVPLPELPPVATR